MGWYLVGMLLVIGGGGLWTAIDGWLLRPATRRAWAVLAGERGFLSSVLIYAWLIDSLRVPYNEPGIWVLFAVGIGGMVLLAWVARLGEG